MILTCHRNSIFKKTMEYEATSRASYRIAQMIAKAGELFTDGVLIKSCITHAEEVCSGKVELFKTVILSAKTAASRMEDNRL
jgi:hypothetical protein